MYAYARWDVRNWDVYVYMLDGMQGTGKCTFMIDGMPENRKCTLIIYWMPGTGSVRLC